MSGGHYRMRRGWMEHPMFAGKPYSEREAWAYLIENTAFMKTPYRHGASLVTIDRGQFSTSYRALAKVWQWSVNRVVRFLAVLESNGMIFKKTDTGHLLLTVCNYDKYQTQLTKSNTHANTAADTRADTKIINTKEVKDSEAKASSSKEVPDWMPLEEWGAWFEMRKKKDGSAFTLHAQKLATAALDKLRLQGYDPKAVLNEAILKSWKSFYPPKGNDNAAPRNPSSSYRQPTKTDRLHDAIRKAAQDGGFAFNAGSGGQAAPSVDAGTMLPSPEIIWPGT